MFWEVLHSDTVRLKATLGQEVLKIFTVELGEAPFAGNKDLQRKKKRHEDICTVTPHDFLKISLNF